MTISNGAHTDLLRDLQSHVFKHSSLGSELTATIPPSRPAYKGLMERSIPILRMQD